MNKKERAKQTYIVQAIFISFLMIICCLGAFIEYVPTEDHHAKRRLEDFGKVYNLKANPCNDTIKEQLNQVVDECLNNPECHNFTNGEKLQDFIQKMYDEKFGHQGVMVNVQTIEAKPKQ